MGFEVQTLQYAYCQSSGRGTLEFQESLEFLEFRDSRKPSNAEPGTSKESLNPLGPRHCKRTGSRGPGRDDRSTRA